MHRVTRDRWRVRADAIERSSSPWLPDGPRTMLGQVTTATNVYGGSPRYVKVNPVALSGPETEGATPTLTADTSKSIVVAVLSGTPSAGDYLACYAEDNRWIARKAGTTSSSVNPPVSMTGCFCPTPTYLTMTTSNQDDAPNDTLTYQPTPAAYSTFGLGPMGFFGDNTHTDVDGDYRWYLHCQNNGYYLDKLYANYLNQGPMRVGNLYSWLLGSPGNTCSPFLLSNGQPAQGAEQIQITVQPK